MGLCVSMLQSKAKKRRPEPRRGTPKALFVVRSDRRPSKPEALVFQAHDSGRSRLQRPGKVDATKYEKCRHKGTDDALSRWFCAQKPRLPCGGTRGVAVEPVAAEGRLPMPARCETATDRGARAPTGRCGTPTMTPMRPSTPMTPMRPVWQRRILMGMRCELPRFSGLILYDEHGRPIQSGTPGRRDHHQGSKKTARTATTLRDLI